MTRLGLSRIALCSAFVLGSSLAIAGRPQGGYHLLKKYSFGAAEGSSREYFDYISVDSGARRVYLSHGTEVKVIDKFSVVETVKTEYGAKTMGLDTKTHNLFVDTADFGPAPAPTPQRPHPQPAPIIGTFRVLVYGR